MAKKMGAFDGGQAPDHGGHGVAEIESVIETEVAVEAEQVVGIGLEVVAVTFGVVEWGVDVGGDDQVEHNHLEEAGEVGHHEPPHMAVAAESVAQDQRLRSISKHPDVEGLRQGGAALLTQLFHLYLPCLLLGLRTYYICRLLGYSTDKLTNKHSNKLINIIFVLFKWFILQ